jgi:hypothetical protein
MSNQTLNQELIENLRNLARSKSLEDKSKSYQQWLNHFSRDHGHSWESLIDQVAALEKTLHLEKLVAAEDLWVTRFSALVWGEIPHPDDHMLPVPLEEGVGIVPWPNGFIGNNIFCPLSDEPHALVSGPVFSIDEDVIEFHGEQLWTVPDSIVFASLIVMSRGLPTGAILDFTSTELEQVAALTPSAVDSQDEQNSFQKSLWRLTHGVLVFERYGFKGPLLIFADVSKAPDQFRVAFNPDFAKFYFPPRPTTLGLKITDKDSQRRPWSEKLAAYFEGRAKRWAPFRFGEWLETLAASELNALLKYLVDSDQGTSSDTEDVDIMNVVLLTTSIEMRQEKVNVNIERIGELLDAFRLAVTCENLKRMGLIELPRTIALSSQEELHFRLTEAGIAAGFDMTQGSLL